MSPFIQCTHSLLALVILVTYPLDLIKGRLQIQGEMALDQHTKGAKTLPNRGMVGTAFGIGIFPLTNP